MFERFFRGNQKEAAVTNEMMLANELRTPKGSYFDNLKMIVAALTLAGFVLPLAPMDKAVAAGPARIATQSVAGGPQETKQISEVNPQAEKAGQQKMKEVVQIENAKKIYQDAYQEAQKNQAPYQEVSFATENQPVALENFLKALGIKINPEVYETLDQADYRAVFCCRDRNTIDRGLILSLRPGDVDHFTQLYPQLEAGLLSWQKTMFSDLKNIFFPDSSFDGANIPKFKTAYANPPEEDQITAATIKDKSGADRFIGYNSSQQKIYLANSQECLKRTLAAHPDLPGL